MKLQSKITIGLLPLILLSFLALGSWSIKTATKDIRASQLDHLNLLVDTFFQEELEKANTILAKNGLNTVNSFVDDYQKTITENTTKRFAGEKQQVTIFDNSGNVIFCSNPLYNNKDFHKQLRPYLQKTISNSGTSLQGHLDHGAEYFNFVARFFPPWRWHVFITTSDELVHHSISYLKKLTLGIAVLLAISCSLLILLLFKIFLVQPIKRLKIISQAIANRQKIESFVPPRNDELGDLAQSIHIMSQDVYAYQESLISGKEVLKKEIQKRTKELEQEKQLAQKYLDVAGVMLGVLDTTGRISMINQKCCRLLEVTEKYVLGKNWFEHFLPEQIISEVTIVFNKLMAGELNLVENYENPVVNSKGQLLMISFHNSVLKNSMGEIVGIIFSGEDITERKQAEEKIIESLREKEILLKEIHHRVKNNLQIISSLLKLQANTIEDERIKENFRESQQRIMVMASVHTQLYQSQNFAAINFADYVQDMTGQLLQAYRTGTAAIGLVINIEEIMLPIDSAIPCGLLINELITNALKYAFPEARKGEITIEAQQTENGVRLIFADNGIGLPNDVDFHTTETLGLRLVQMLVKQLDGSIELSLEKGTRYVIQFKPATNQEIVHV